MNYLSEDGGQSPASRPLSHAQLANKKPLLRADSVSSMSDTSESNVKQKGPAQPSKPITQYNLKCSSNQSPHKKKTVNIFQASKEQLQKRRGAHRPQTAQVDTAETAGALGLSSSGQLVATPKVQVSLKGMRKKPDLKSRFASSEKHKKASFDQLSSTYSKVIQNMNF